MLTPSTDRIRRWTIAILLTGLTLNVPLPGFAQVEDLDLGSETATKPSFPKATIDDPAAAAEYAKAIEHLEKREYDDAKTIFGKLRRSLDGAAKEAAERCYEEANGGLEHGKISTKAGKGQYRKAIRDCTKALEKYEGLIIAVDLQALLDECNDKIFHEIETFEKAGSKPEPADEPEDEGGEDEGGNGRGGNRGNQGGATGFGQNTSIVSQDVDLKNKRALLTAPVREGKKALLWRTGRDLSFVTFEKLSEPIKDFRYLNISVRCEDSKSAPNLRLFFDAEEGNLNAGQQGGGGRRGAGRAGARVMNRMGFATSIQPKVTWQDLRIDLKKFKPQGGSVKWDDVIALRIIHMQGADGRIHIDNVRLERE